MRSKISGVIANANQEGFSKAAALAVLRQVVEGEGDALAADFGPPNAPSNSSA